MAQGRGMHAAAAREECAADWERHAVACREIATKIRHGQPLPPRRLARTMGEGWQMISQTLLVLDGAGRVS